MKSLHKKDACASMFIIEALFTIAKIGNQPRCPSAEECIRKMWYVYITDYYSVIKRKKSCYVQQHGWNWKTLSCMKEARHRKTNINVVTHLWKPVSQPYRSTDWNSGH
jgi:hypothetical protein